MKATIGFIDYFGIIVVTIVYGFAVYDIWRTEEKARNLEAEDLWLLNWVYNRLTITYKEDPDSLPMRKLIKLIKSAEAKENKK